MRRATVFLALAAAGCLAIARGEDKDRDGVTLDVVVERGAPLELEALLRLWSRRLAVPIYVDPQLAGTRIKLAEGPLPWGVFREVLSFHDVVLEERLACGRAVMFAHHRRNLGRVPAGGRVFVIPVDSTAACVSSQR